MLTSDRVGHRVQFYEDDAFLVTAVCDFVAAGLTSGQPVVVIATDAHRALIEQRLRPEVVQRTAAARGTRLVMLDAISTLERILVGDVPDPARFRAVVLGAIEHARAGNDGTVVRVYGEMVDVLCRARRYDAALRLEEMWNEIGQDYAFSLLCAYAMTNFSTVTGAQRFGDVCRHHTHVVPPDRNSVAEEEARRLVDGVLEEWATARGPRESRAVGGATVDYVIQDFALAPLLREILDALEPLLVARHLTCDVTVESARMPLTARADRDRTQEILVTLLTNAIKFTPPGGRVAVQLSAGAIEPDTVRIRVTDTGVGISSPTLDRIFDPVGLGLTISRDLARGMGGELTVSSALGVGATFSLTLPAVPSGPPPSVVRP